jgi:hypothetical protein
VRQQLRQPLAMARVATSLLFVTLTAMVAGCGGGGGGGGGPKAPVSEPRSFDQVARGCPVTIPQPPASRRYGSPDLLEAAAPGNGMIVAVRPGAKPAAGESMVTEDVRADGRIGIKLPWFRAPEASTTRARGYLRITGKSLDGRAGRVRGEYPPQGRRWSLQPGGLVFPSEGCWKVIGRVGRAKLAFVVSVVDCASATSRCESAGTPARS